MSSIVQLDARKSFRASEEQEINELPDINITITDTN